MPLNFKGLFYARKSQKNTLPTHIGKVGENVKWAGFEHRKITIRYLVVFNFLYADCAILKMSDFDICLCYSLKNMSLW